MSHSKPSGINILLQQHPFLSEGFLQDNRCLKCEGGVLTALFKGDGCHWFNLCFYKHIMCFVFFYGKSKCKVTCNSQLYNISIFISKTFVGLERFLDSNCSLEMDACHIDTKNSINLPGILLEWLKCFNCHAVFKWDLKIWKLWRVSALSLPHGVEQISWNKRLFYSTDQ